MKIDNIHLVYYSATYTSQRIGREIASTIDNTFSELDITMHTPSNKIALQPCDLLIMVMPVFGGLIPSEAAERLNMVHGANTPAIIVAVYGVIDTMTMPCAKCKRLPLVKVSIL